MSALVALACQPTCTSAFAEDAVPVPVLGDIEVTGQTSGHQFTFDGVAFRPDGDGDFDASDALQVLRGAVSGTSCTACICDVSGSGRVTASDALAVLQYATGLPREFRCGACR